jgi:serine/threonine protein kinase/tetratricopeptide (TPR) repeat protein
LTLAIDWQQVDRLLEAALEREPGRRADFLTEACGGNEGLRREVESLLAAHDRAGSFIETAPGNLVAEMLNNGTGALSSGQLIGPYRIVAPIGAGGMGQVYLAEDARLGRRVALKILPRDLAADSDRVRRFIQEARAASAINHQNVCTIYDVGETSDHRPFIAMEYIEGRTLTVENAQRQLESERIIDICSQVAEALDQAHLQGIVHRDIKPANIMITGRGAVKVLDFGLAKVARSSPKAPEDASTEAKTAPWTVMGTVNYMSPEQALGREVDHRSDIFSLGIVMYEMAAGRLPFEGPNAPETIDRIIHSSPDPLSQINHSVSPELEGTIFKCLEKDCERRFQSARELADAMQSPGPTARWKSNAIRHNKLRFKVLLTVFALLFIVAALVYAARFRKARPLAQAEIRSLAVLPLKSIGGDHADDYLGLGIADTIITRVSQVGGLTVRPTSAVRKYSSLEIDSSEAASQLKVDSVLDGTVQRMGDRLHVNLTLRSVPGDILLWSDSFNLSFTDIFAMQEDIGQKVAAQLRLGLAPQKGNGVDPKYSVNAEAYDYYLRGMFHLRRENKTDIDAAVENLERAIQIDRDFAIAHAELAIAYNNKTFFFAPQENLEEKAFVAVGNALRLDNDLAEAHLARGILLWTHSQGFPHEKAVAELRQALALNSSLDDAHQRLALVYVHVGLAAKALQEAQEAVAINPNNTLASYRIGVALQLQGKYGQAFDVYERIPREVTPAVWGFNSARSLFYLGRREEASARLEEILNTLPQDEGGVLTSTQALLLAAAGQKRQAENKIKMAVEKGKGFGHFHHTAYNIASAYALMNEPERAMHWLEQTAADGMPCYPLFDQDPNLNNLRQYSPFQIFMAKQNEQFERYRATL